MKNILSNLTFEKLKFNEINTIKELETEQNISILSLNSIYSDFGSDTSKYYIVKYNDLIVAYTNFSIVCETIEINSIVVKKDFKRKKIGTFILNNILEISRINNIERVLLEVRLSNIPGKMLYENFGFKKINIRKKYYPDNHEDAIIYEYKVRTD